ncbi:MAG: type II toxin-antitoxin system RelE/ParE family toxin [Polyangiaceae bacterium]|jgi:plasmid stabilization system protein ParE|nr:type II toxin-antitoxin system RelE/ParE family toxin [Polyangiaceae bacterium]
MKLDFSVEARLDLFAAQDHYESERDGLGQEFIAEMYALAEKVALMPLGFPVISPDARRALAKRFPYMLVFFVLDDAVRIVAVLHQHQHPDTWRNRG